MMLPTCRKALVHVFVNVLLWFHAMRKDHIYLSVKSTFSHLKLLDDEAWKSSANKRKRLFDRILKKYEPPEISEPEVGDDDKQTEEQQKAAPKGNEDEGGGGRGDSNKLNVALVSPSEQMALQAKIELLREGRKRGYDGFTPEDTAEIENMKKRTNMDTLGSHKLRVKNTDLLGKLETYILLNLYCTCTERCFGKTNVLYMKRGFVSSSMYVSYF